MNSFISAFSFYEFLRVLLPGAYTLIAARDFMNLWGLRTETFENDSFNTLLSLVLIFSIGLFVYAWDFPKMFRKFQKDLPTNKIKSKHDLNKLTIANSYFNFYNKLSDENKLKTEKYSGFFHLAVNLSVVSFTIIVLGLINYLIGFKSDFQIINLIILILSVLTACLIYVKRLRYAFQRHLAEYYKSDEYKTLLNQEDSQ